MTASIFLRIKCIHTFNTQDTIEVARKIRFANPLRMPDKSRCLLASKRLVEAQGFSLAIPTINV
jgi:hypothetical protein